MSSWRHVVSPRGASCCSLFLLESALNGCVVSSLQRVGVFGECCEVSMHDVAGSQCIVRLFVEVS